MADNPENVHPNLVQNGNILANQYGIVRRMLSYLPMRDLAACCQVNAGGQYLQSLEKLTKCALFWWWTLYHHHPPTHINGTAFHLHWTSALCQCCRSSGVGRKTGQI